MLFAGVGLPASAAGDETPSSLPLGPDDDTFYLHVAKDFDCSLAAAAMADGEVSDPYLYATNTADDPCAKTTEDTRGAKSMLSGAATVRFRLLPEPDQPLELVAGDPVTADVWVWAENAGIASPRITLQAAGWTGTHDEGVLLDPTTVETAPDGRVWYRFEVTLGTAPATVATGPIDLVVDLDNNGEEQRRASAVRSGIGVTPGHRSSFTLPLDVQVDEPGDPVAAWPGPLELATVRPGVKHVTAGAQCTTNFVFRDLDTNKLYMGTAAHCVDNVGVGGKSTIGTFGGGSTIEATVAFLTRDFRHHTGVGSDFALLEIPADREQDVHPAVLHFGGPTKLADMGTVDRFDKVITYGNSGLRPGPGQLDAHEGVVTGTSKWYTAVYTITPGIPGDSGSGVMTADGGAIGAASTVEIAPITGQNRFGNIAPVLDWLNQNGWNLELQTWELLDEGVLPGPSG